MDMYAGAGGLDNKHGVGVLLNRKWFTSPAVDMRITKSERCTNASRLAQTNLKNRTIMAEDFTVEFESEIGAERVSVGQKTLNESNKRGDWLKHWLMFHSFVALNTTFKKRPKKQIA